MTELLDETLREALKWKQNHLFKGIRSSIKLTESYILGENDEPKNAVKICQRLDELLSVLNRMENAVSQCQA